MVLADHIQRVVKGNFAASWEEIGEENQVEQTYALSSMKDLPGTCDFLPPSSVSCPYTCVLYIFGNIEGEVKKI